MTQDYLSADLPKWLEQLSVANQAYADRFPGLAEGRQPVHTLYGGANLYVPGAADKIAELARRHFSAYAPDPEVLGRILGIADKSLLDTLHERVTQKLNSEAIESHCADFEDGYGIRSDEEEDGHAVSAAKAMAEGKLSGRLPPFVGIRIKALSEEAKARSLRTVGLFVSTLCDAGQGLPDKFSITLPKVTTVAQVSVLDEVLSSLEKGLGLPENSIGIQLMLENVQSLFTAAGHLAIPEFVGAAPDRVHTLVLGTFDYTATANVTANLQTHDHPAADFARQMMHASLTGTRVALCDGVTNIMPIPPHRGADLTEAQQAENLDAVHDAWKLHFDNILHSMRLGIYQGWDLNPAQIPIRFSAVYYFYLLGLEDASARLRTFVDKASQASMVGNTFDDAATGQGLVNFFLNGIACGALTLEDLSYTGLSEAELQSRSFNQIVENRMKAS